MGLFGRSEEDEHPTELPTFSSPPAASSSSSAAPAQADSSGRTTFGSFLQVPQPTRPKAPSVRLSYRSEDNRDTNSIYRSRVIPTIDAASSGLSKVFGGGGRKRATTVSGSSIRGRDQPEEDNDDTRSWISGRARSVRGSLRNPGGRRARAISALGNFWDRGQAGKLYETEAEKEEREKRESHDQQVLDLLDVIDPEVGTLTTLSDVQNSLFVPALGRFVDRSRFIRLTKPDAAERAESIAAEMALKQHSSPSSTSAATRVRTKDEQKLAEEKGAQVEARGKYLVLPEGLVDWEHWTDEDKAELDDYVRHLLHSRKWKAKRTWRGFKHYVSTPLGAFVFIYASLLTFWGAAWILFIIGWLHAGDRQDYFVEICDQVLTALFCVVGIGLAPFRTVDTYHMSTPRSLPLLHVANPSLTPPLPAVFIAHYHRKTLRLLKEQGAKPLSDENDLPAPAALRPPGQVEEGDVRPPVLTPKEQATLIYHQTKFNRSHTFYRPHETFTHKAFPLDLLIVVVCLLDFHSIFQIALGSTTWSISYHHQFKKILTSVILSFSISCNITAGLVITVGNRRTRKEEVVREQLHKAVTEEAVRLREQRKEKEIQKEQIDAEVHRSLLARPQRPYLA